LQTSAGGTVLYAVNSDFDLQFNGGTLQSYDLSLIRQDALKTIANPADPTLPHARGITPGCPDNPPTFIPGTGTKQPLGATCAPPMDSTHYVRDTAIIGAFATNLLLTLPPDQLVSRTPKVHADDPVPAPAPRSMDRLFTPVRGSATLTWASVARDNFASGPDAQSTKANYAPFRIDCGQESKGRCDSAHQIGQNINEPGNSRHITMPGEPFGMAFSEDGTALLTTHQDDPDTSLFTTGVGRDVSDAAAVPPALQFVLQTVPVGGMGVAPIPHDPNAFLGSAALPHPSFLQTNRVNAQVSLLQQYADDGLGLPPSLPRPFLNIVQNFPITLAAGGSDSLGITIDPTPRLSCEARVAPIGPGQTQATRDAQMMACAQKPARAFIANRTPPALLVGDVGATQGIDGAFDPDQLVLHTSIPLSAGASNVYLAPVVDKDGAYALRVFVVCFDSATVYIYDPDAGVLENVVHVGIGPFAMAFDPFSLTDVATHAQVPLDSRGGSLGLRRWMSRARTSSTCATRRSSSSPGRSSRTCCSPTRSTAHRRRPSPPSSRSWRSAK
jgi:hypothetical protein